MVGLRCPLLEERVARRAGCGVARRALPMKIVADATPPHPSFQSVPKRRLECHLLLKEKAFRARRAPCPPAFMRGQGRRSRR